MLATGSCWRPASTRGLVRAQGSAPSKLGASGGAAKSGRSSVPLFSCLQGLKSPHPLGSRKDLALLSAVSAIELGARRRRSELVGPGVEEE